ncbi:MAG: TIGR03088 family PEP-CTERM/XrtA system glycosyltransferase [Acidobacteria bacterium]|nr:TIGR03088 family PEP-CTERM/XrtA system glycosyltransferase [Acidobacteriota bacterium]MCI0724273.1 TIGR03088 family PEP-CTERM/XrtA system glycosyltransferase [Acidobacteriota bacterium]
MTAIESRQRPVKIVHVLHSFDVGGLENGVVNLINHLDEEKYAHVVCCLTRAGRLVGRLQRKDVEIIELGKTGGHDWRLPLRLARLFKSLQPQIVHTRNWGTIDGIPAAWLSKVPVIVHGEHGRTMTEVNGDHFKRTLLRRALAPLVDRFVTVSAELANWLREEVRVHPAKIRRICNGVDLKRFSEAVDKSRIRGELGLDLDAFVVGTVGRLDPIKDQGALVEATAWLSPRFPLLRLVIVGNGPCYDHLDQLRKRLGLEKQVLLLGEQDDVPRLMQSFDVFALPSLFEGISNTLLEAMASGLPVIATRVGGNVELVEDQITGMLIAKQDLPVFVACLEAYLSNHGLVKLHSKAARHRAEKRFGLTRMIDDYDRLYSELRLKRRVVSRAHSCPQGLQ